MTAKVTFFIYNHTFLLLSHCKASTRALILSFWFFFFRIKTKEKEYSVTLPKIGKAWKIIRNCSLLGSSLKIQAHIYFLPEKLEPGKRHFLDD